MSYLTISRRGREHFIVVILSKMAITSHLLIHLIYVLMAHTKIYNSEKTCQNMEKCLTQSLEDKIQGGYKLIERLKVVRQINGVGKLSRKINQEIKFLRKVQSEGTVKKEHLQSTNLIHLEAMVKKLLVSKDPIGVLKPFKIQGTRLEIDVICNGGGSWVKVIARNARALTMISLGNGEFGQKSVLDQAQAYLNCAILHPHHYQVPEVIFHFACGVEAPLASRLEKLGVIIEGDKINAYQDGNIEDLEAGVRDDNSEVVDMFCDTRITTIDLELMNSPKIQTLNLDVSTLLAYVSNMTNGKADFIYQEPLLTLQAEWERARPVKPVLDELFQGKELLVCRTAYENFLDIIKIIGGSMETRRAHEFLNHVRVVADAINGQIFNLKIGGKIKNRSRLVFAAGEDTKSITISANEGFVRAARMQGIECTVVLHEPRSLSEIKEKHAKNFKIS